MPQRSDFNNQSAEVKNKLEDLVRSQTAGFDQGFDQLDDLQRLVQDLYYSVLDSQQDTMRQQFLNGLKFPGMHDREETVSAVHEDTFRWLLEGRFETDDEKKEKSPIHERYSNWLLNGDGVFHIAAKLGSGKSTLMKYASHRDVTRAKLQRWAGTKVTFPLQSRYSSTERFYIIFKSLRLNGTYYHALVTVARVQAIDRSAIRCTS
jgi:hypothetical protein